MYRSIRIALYASAAFMLVGSSLDFGGYLGFSSVSTAKAQGQGGGGSDHGGGQGAGQGGQGAGQGGQGAGQGGQGAGQGGPGEDSEGKGPKAGQGGKVDTRGKPAWAQEGIPEVELGRLSVARSPSKVLDRALVEVLKNWDPSIASLYNMSAEAFATYVAANWDTITIVDSPLQNLAMLEALYDGKLNLTAMGINPASKTDLAAIFVGVASDKTVPITKDTITALNVIMDLGLDSGTIAALAAKAEDVREGVLEGHG